MKMDELTTKLPFDQFTRQNIVSYLIDEVLRKDSKKKTFNIIDVGGHLGMTKEFQSKDKVTVLDVFDEKYDNYVKGDATSIKFSDESFDIACSFDVFEHIPRNKRQAFINESLRVSKMGIFLAVPIDIEKKVSKAENLLNNFYKNIASDDHKWLKEHIDNKIPNDNDILQLIDKSGAFQTSVPSNQIGDWQLMQMLLFSSSKIPDIVGEVSDINTWYNEKMLPFSSQIDTGYRKIFFVSKDKKNVDKVANFIKLNINKSLKDTKLVTVNEKTFIEFSETLSLIIKKYALLSEKCQSICEPGKDIVETFKYLKETISNENNRNIELSDKLSDIYNSKSWKILESIKSIIKPSQRVRK